MKEAEQACSIANCPLPADRYEEGEAGDWTVRLYYCREHGREREKGTPMGGLTVDGCRVGFVAKEMSEPMPGGKFHAIGPH